MSLFYYYYYLLFGDSYPLVLLPLGCLQLSLLEVIALDDFVISPDPFIQKCKSLARAKNPVLEAVDRRVRLAWMNDGAADFMERADVIGLGIPYDMLLDALSEAGGAIDINGSYPIGNAIRQRLRKLLNAKCA